MTFMSAKLTLSACLILAAAMMQECAIGSPANPSPIVFYDESGSKLTGPSEKIYIRGDERFHWLEDSAGYTVIQEKAMSLTYAEIDDLSGHLISTGIKVGDRLRAGIEKHLQPSSNARRVICGVFCDDRIAAHAYGFNNQFEHENRRRLMEKNSSLKNLVVLIRFSDHSDRNIPEPSEYDVLMNGPGGEGTSAPSGSVNDVFLANSYGTFSLESVVYPWITVSQTEAGAAGSKSGLGPSIFSAIREALDVIDNDPNFDMSAFNADHGKGDGFIDAITIFHSGYGAEFGGTDCFGREEVDRIWSHKWFLYDGDWISNDKKVRVRNYQINSGMWNTCSTNIARIGVVAHETFHFLGLPDLYDTDGSSSGLGVYCVMSDSWGVDASQYYPPLLNPWARIVLGWAAPLSLEETGDYHIKQSCQFSDFYKVEHGFADGEYLLIENRQPCSYDKLLPLGGLAIWHVDQRNYLNGNSEESLENDPFSNQFISLLQADGKYDLELGRNRGDFSDLFREDYYHGVDHLSPSKGQDPSNGPFPNTDSFGGGLVKRTNNFVAGISSSEAAMKFSFTRSPCHFDEVYFKLAMSTDGKAEEISWSLKDASSGELVMQGNGYEDYALVKETKCLASNECYVFTIEDIEVGLLAVRVNGQRVVSGGLFGLENEAYIGCDAPTPSPTQIPSVMPSLLPSTQPTRYGNCNDDETVLEVMVKGELVEHLDITILDMHGGTVLSSEGPFIDTIGPGADFRLKQCALENDCYTLFTNVGSRTSDLSGTLSVALGSKEVIMEADTDQLTKNSHYTATSMFGDSCLRNGDDLCSTNNASMSLFRIELALASSNDDIYLWELQNKTQTLLWGETSGECAVNSLAQCLPREDCYEFNIISESKSLRIGGSFTIMFSHMNGGNIIQNHTGSVIDGLRLRLGSCYNKHRDAKMI